MLHTAGGDFHPALRTPKILGGRRLAGNMRESASGRFGAKELSRVGRSEEHTSELQSLMRISYAVFCLTKKTHSLKSRNFRSEEHTSQLKQQLHSQERVTCLTHRNTTAH